MRNTVSAVILAGGLGTRARSISQHTPKVLLEVRGRPFLCFLLDFLRKARFDRVLLCTGYKADVVEQALGSRFAGMQLEYSREPSPLGTAGALRQASPLLHSPWLLVLNGDSYCGCDLESLCEVQLARPQTGTIGVVRVPDSGRYGRVEVDHNRRITAFTEKTAMADPGWINAGIYLLNRDWVTELPPGKSCSLERDVFPVWVARGLYAHCCPGPFLDIGTPESYAQAAGFFATLEDRV